MIHSMKRADIILIIACLLAAFLLAVFFMVRRSKGNVLHVTCDGMEVYQMELNTTYDSRQPQYYLILYEEQEEEGMHVHIMHSADYPKLPDKQKYNLFSVTDGTVEMEAADCKDQICVHHRPIFASRENIICLPHRLVIEISSGSNRADSGSGERQSKDSGNASEEWLDGVVR